MTQADVTLILEGTYPYVSGGVSSWVHQLLEAYPQRTFSLVHIGPEPGYYSHQVFDLPKNVSGLQDLYCRGAKRRMPRRMRWTGPASDRAPSRVLAAIGRIHLEDRVDDALLSDLCAGDLTVREFLHGDESFSLLQRSLYPRLGKNTSFADFFWHFRALHIPLLRLLNSQFAQGRVYHAASAGYAGLVGAVASVRTGHPFIMTEHGIYARERQIELARARWIRDEERLATDTVRPSPLRDFWCHFFKMLSRIAYHQATRIITLSETNRRRQVADGALVAKTDVVPNGVDHARFSKTRDVKRDKSRFRVGFVGRIVPIKDVVTLLRAFHVAHTQSPMELWLVGPEDEDPRYAARCRTLVTSMGLDDKVQFLGLQPVTEIYPQLDALVLTSISEGQPLVILEAFASSLPVIATDVGACRELIGGRDSKDRQLGPAGIVTRVANPMETSSALCFLATNQDARRAMGSTGQKRVVASYQQSQVVSRYDRLYKAVVSS